MQIAIGHIARRMPGVGLVRVYLQQGKRDEARKHYTILRQLHPKDAEPLAHLFAS